MLGNSSNYQPAGTSYFFIFHHLGRGVSSYLTSREELQDIAGQLTGFALPSILAIGACFLLKRYATSRIPSLEVRMIANCSVYSLAAFTFLVFALPSWKVLFPTYSIGQWMALVVRGPQPNGPSVEDTSGVMSPSCSRSRSPSHGEPDRLTQWRKEVRTFRIVRCGTTIFVTILACVGLTLSCIYFTPQQAHPLVYSGLQWITASKLRIFGVTIPTLIWFFGQPLWTVMQLSTCCCPSQKTSPRGGSFGQEMAGTAFKWLFDN